MNGFAIRRALTGTAAAGLLAAATLGAAAAPSAAEDEIDTEYGRMILVLDSSGSMAEKVGGTRKIDAAKDALDRVIDDLPDGAHVGLRVFGATVFSRHDAGACDDTQLVVEPGTGNRDELRRAVSGYEPYGETPIPAALRRAAEDLGSEGKRSIVLVSDGESTCTPDPCEVAAELTGQGIDLQVDVVGLSVRGAARNQLRCIAKWGQGTYYDAEDAAELTRVLTRVGERAANPYAAIGTPVAGGPDALSATTIEAGDSLDTLTGPGTAGGQRWYRYERAIPGSTVHFTASMMHVGADPGASDQVQVQGFAGSAECGRDQDSATRQYRPVLAAAVAVPGYRQYDEACTEAAAYTFAVTRGDGTDYGLDVEAPLEIRIIEEPPVVDPDSYARSEDSEQPRIDLSHPADGPEGGNSFGEAEPIEPGALAGTLVPGETQIFKIAAGWGQTVSAAVDFPPANAALAEALGDRSRYTALWLYSPARGLVNSTSYSRSQGTFSAHYTSSALNGQSYPIAWANRTSYVGAQAASSVAGDHYVVVSLVGVEDEQSTTEVPFVLGVAVTGKVRGAPSYVDGAAAIGDRPAPPADEDEANAAAESGGQEVEPADASREATGDDGGEEGAGMSGLAVGAAVLGGGLLALLVAGLLLARRRAGAGR